MRENPRTQDSTCVLPYVFTFYQKSKMILWSIRTFWYKGSAENTKKKHVRKKAYISQKQQPETQSVFFQKQIEIWCIKVNIG